MTRPTPILRKRPEAEKLRYAMLTLTRMALADDPHLRAYVLALGGTLGFTALIDAEGQRMSLRMGRVRRDVVRQQLLSRNVRMALCILFLPEGYELSKSKCRTCGQFFEHNAECPDA